KQTVNIMTLGGLALAIGILVDMSTVVIENIHTHLEKRSRGAKRLAAEESAVGSEAVVPPHPSLSPSGGEGAQRASEGQETARTAHAASVARAVVDSGQEVAVPLLVAMLCVLAVFVPSFFMVGAAKAMFVPL